MNGYALAAIIVVCTTVLLSVLVWAAVRLDARKIDTTTKAG